MAKVHIKFQTSLLEGAILLGAMPFLLFPERFIVGTLLALVTIILIETIPILCKWRPIQAPSPVDIPLLLFIFLLGISILVTADPDLTLSKAVGIILGVAVWRYLSRAVQRPFHWYLALGFFGLLGAGFIGLGVLTANWISKTNFLAAITNRIPNLSIVLPGLGDGAAHPNQIAGTLLFFVPLLWSVFLGTGQAKYKKARILAGILALLATAVLILTQSRAGWLGGVGGLFSLILLWAIVLPMQSKQKKTFFCIAGILAIVGIIALFIIGPDRLVALWQDPAQETVVGSFNSLGFRQEVWRWTVLMLQDFPFTGIGLGSFQRVIRRLYPINVTPSFVITHAHNLFLQTAVDFGLFGLINYLALIGVFLTMLWQTARQNISLRPYALGFMASLIAYHIYGLGDVLDSKTNLVIWITYGLITSLYQISHPPQKIAI